MWPRTRRHPVSRTSDETLGARVPQARDLAAAESVRHQVEHSGGAARRKATTLFGYFGVRNLTDATRERVATALGEAGLTAEPPIHAARRHEFITIQLDEARRRDGDREGGVAATPDPHRSARGTISSLPDLVEEVAPAVVHVTNEEGQGSGFAVDHEGFLITNAHVVGEATDHQVKLSAGETVGAKVLGLDRSTDLAVLIVDTRELPTLSFRPLKTVRVGESVLAVGSPVGLEWSVTTGIVSGKDRSMPAPDGGQINYMIQTDADINPGNSGGPLTGLDGQVVGVNTSGLDLPGLNFAVPSDTAEEVYSEIREHGDVRRARIGARVALEPFFGDDRELWGQDGGARVTSVAEGSPAGRAGLRVDDVVIALDDELVDEPGDIFRLLNRERIDREYTLRFIRDGRESGTTVVPEARKA